MLSFITLVLTLITSYKVFEKYGLTGWHGIVPFLNQYEEYGMVWNSGIGLVSIILGIVSGILSTISKNTEGFALVSILSAVIGIAYFVINLIFATKKSKAFGGKLGLTLALIFVPFFANLYIGFSSNCQYVGNTSEF